MTTFGGTTVAMVDATVNGDSIVASCLPGWTQAHLIAAFQAAGVEEPLYLKESGFEEDGTEWFVFTKEAG